jgi:hypothetical protein
METDERVWPDGDPLGSRRLYLAIFYRSPWDRWWNLAMQWGCWRLADRLQRRDFAWRERWAHTEEDPPPQYKRRLPKK